MGDPIVSRLKSSPGMIKIISRDENIVSRDYKKSSHRGRLERRFFRRPQRRYSISSPEMITDRLQSRLVIVSGDDWKTPDHWSSSPGMIFIISRDDNIVSRDYKKSSHRGRLERRSQNRPLKNHWFWRISSPETIKYRLRGWSPPCDDVHTGTT